MIFLENVKREAKSKRRKTVYSMISWKIREADIELLKKYKNHTMKGRFKMQKIKYEINEQIKEVERELLMRRRVYSGKVKAGKMKAENARKSYDLMKAVLDTLKSLRKKKLQIK